MTKKKPVDEVAQGLVTGPVLLVYNEFIRNKPMTPPTHAETLIKVTEEYTLRLNVCIAVLEYLLNNFAYDHETSDEDDCGYAGRYVDVEDIHQLVHEMKKLR